MNPHKIRKNAQKRAVAKLSFCNSPFYYGPVPSKAPLICRKWLMVGNFYAIMKKS
jgi:hypothetical protein